MRPPAETALPGPPAGFDGIAGRYAMDERDNPAFAYLRRRSFERLAEAFVPTSANASTSSNASESAHAHAPRLLELGVGAGTEAARLAATGARIALVDDAGRMLETAQANVRAVDARAVLGAHLLPARRVGELVAVYGAGTFDGAYSCLGPLNCEPDLQPVAAGLGALVRPGGTVILSVMNRTCAVETAWFALHGQWRAARRRWNGPLRASVYPGGPAEVMTWYYARAHIERAFAPTFVTESAEALPLLWPPTYLDGLVRRFPGLYAALEPWDQRLSRWPVLRDLGDHVLLRLRRRSAR